MTTRARALAGLLLASALTACTATASERPPTTPTPSTAAPYPASLHVAMPAPIGGTLPACAREPRKPGWVRRENSLPGTRAWRVPSGEDAVVDGYADSFSFTCGQTLRVHADGWGARAHLEVFRLGWYAGKGGRLIARTGDVRVDPRPVTHRQDRHTADEHWPVVFSLPITRAWTPGTYLAELVTSAGRYPIPFVVTDPADRTPLLVMDSTLTWTAYNNFGGYSLYWGPDHKSADRAYVASLDRPLAGSGYEHPFLTDLPLVPLAERLGIDVSYTTDIDIDRRPQQLLRHNCIVIGGHAEYWTRRMYDGVEAARNKGVNVAVFGGNEVFWQARISGGANPRTMTVYRKRMLDPDYHRDPPLTTTYWRGVGRDSAELTGETMSALPVVGGGYRVATAPSWLFAGTRLHVGSLLDDVVSNEVDAVSPDEPGTPPDVQVVMEGLVHGKGRVSSDGWSYATAAYYSAPSGAAVFDAGTTRWVCDTDNSCPAGQNPGAGARRLVAQITANVLRAFAHRAWGANHPSVRRLPTPVPALLSELPTGARGFLGGGKEKE